MNPKFNKGEMVRISNHPDKNMIGKEVLIVNVFHSHYNSMIGIVDEWIYKVSYGIKTLGWVNECDLQRLKDNQNEQN